MVTTAPLRISKPDAQKFGELFQGNTSCYGVHIPVPTKDGVKASGKSFTETKPLTTDTYWSHLCGTKSIGVVPIDHDGNVRFAVLDVDIYEGLNVNRYLRIISNAGLPLIPFRSKSGGLHLYCFFSEDTEAVKVIPAFNKLRMLFGLADGTEIFPKQAKLAEGKQGNWINLPYFGEDKGVPFKRYAYDEAGEPILDLYNMFTYVESKRVTIRGLQQSIMSAPMYDAPPCLQSVVLDGGPPVRCRNDFMFELATYAQKKYGETYEQELAILDESFDDPLGYSELCRTVVKSHNKGNTQTFRCRANAFISGICADLKCRTECEKREHGIDSVSNVAFENLQMITAGGEVYFKWTVCGVVLTFFGARELRNQQLFIDKCMEQAGVTPRELPKKTWERIYMDAFQNREELTEDSDALSDYALWCSELHKFLASRTAIRPSQVEDGRVYYNTEEGKIYFKGPKLLTFLKNTKLFPWFKNAQHTDLLRSVGATDVHLWMPDLNKSKRAWCIEVALLEEKIGQSLELVKIGDDYTDEDTGDTTLEDFVDDSEDKF